MENLMAEKPSQPETGSQQEPSRRDRVAAILGQKPEASSGNAPSVTPTVGVVPDSQGQTNQPQASPGVEGQAKPPQQLPENPRHGMRSSDGEMVFVQVDGVGTWRPIKEIADGYSFNAHNTRVSMELAKLRKDLELKEAGLRDREEAMTLGADFYRELTGQTVSHPVSPSAPIPMPTPEDFDVDPLGAAQRVAQIQTSQLQGEIGSLKNQIAQLVKVNEQIVLEKQAESLGKIRTAAEQELVGRMSQLRQVNPSLPQFDLNSLKAEILSLPQEQARIYLDNQGNPHTAGIELYYSRKLLFQVPPRVQERVVAGPSIGQQPPVVEGGSGPSPQSPNGRVAMNGPLSSTDDIVAALQLKRQGR